MGSGADKIKKGKGPARTKSKANIKTLEQPPEKKPESKPDCEKAIDNRGVEDLICKAEGLLGHSALEGVDDSVQGVCKKTLQRFIDRLRSTLPVKDA